jgi:hypothetical protein
MRDIVTSSSIFRALLVLVLSIALTGCYERHSVSVGRINLSEKGSECQTRFKWSYHYTPEMLLVLTDTNGATRPFRAHPDWPIVIQLEVIDTDGGQTVLSNHVTQADMTFMQSDSPSTCLSFPIVRQPENLEADHRYKFVLTVVQEVKGLGFAHAYMWWVVGDSM